MQVAIVTFDGFNEIDTFVPLTILNRVRAKGLEAYIAAPTPEVTSMNGVVVQRQRPLDFAAEADAVIIGSGIGTRLLVTDTELMAQIKLDPSRQLIGAQCSGTLVLANLGYLGSLPACTDLATKPWVVAAGVEVIDAPFVAHGNVATAGGCLAAQYLASWVIARLLSLAEAREAMRLVAPVGEKDAYVERALAVVRPFLDVTTERAA